MKIENGKLMAKTFTIHYISTEKTNNILNIEKKEIIFNIKKMFPLDDKYFEKRFL